jgi:drug/metabolite transporter (DMT)-like permease
MLALALALGASVAWGGSDFMAGLASRRLPLLAVLVGSQAAGLALLVALLAITGEGAPPGDGALIAAGAGVLELLGFTALYKSLALGPMSVVAPISSAAALVPVTASVAGGERPATVAALGMGLALAGAALACVERGGEAASAGRRVVPGAAMAVFAALCFGGFFTAMNAATDVAGPAWAVALNRSTSVSVLLAAVALMRPRLGFAAPDLAAVAAVGLLDGAANAMFAFALTEGLTSTVSVLGSLYPVTTVMLAALLLRERVAPLQASGVAAVLTGVALVSAHP